MNCHYCDLTLICIIKSQAIKFRKFWGEKAELRRFKDGNIAESTGN